MPNAEVLRMRIIRRPLEIHLVPFTVRDWILAIRYCGGRCYSNDMDRHIAIYLMNYTERATLPHLSLSNYWAMFEIQIQILRLEPTSVYSPEMKSTVSKRAGVVQRSS